MTNIDKTVVSTEKTISLSCFYLARPGFLSSKSTHTQLLHDREEKITELEIVTNLCRREEKKQKQTCSLFKNCRHFFYFQIES